jgi:hypothetical protein
VPSLWRAWGARGVPGTVLLSSKPAANLSFSRARNVSSNGLAEPRACACCFHSPLTPVLAQGRQNPHKILPPLGRGDFIDGAQQRPYGRLGIRAEG